MNHGSADGQAWLVRADGQIVSEELAPGERVQLPLLQAGPPAGITRAGHRVVTQGPIQAAALWTDAARSTSGLLPVTAWGTDHYLMARPSLAPVDGLQTVSILANQEATQVTVDYAQPTRDGTSLRASGSVWTYTLDTHDVLVLEAESMGGTRIRSDVPIAVFDHHRSPDGPDEAKGTVGEQVPPTTIGHPVALPCLGRDVEYLARVMTLRSDTRITTWGHSNTFSTQDYEHPGQVLPLDLWNGGVEVFGNQPLQASQVLGDGTEGLPDFAYVPPQSTWAQEVAAPVPVLTAGGTAHVVAIHRANDPVTFSTGHPVTLQTLRSGAWACSVSSPIPDDRTSVTVSAPEGVGAMVWTRDEAMSVGTLATVWPPCLALEVGVDALRVHAAATEQGIAVVWSDPEGDCQGGGFTVERSRDAGPYEAFADTESPGLTDRTAELCVPYTYRVSRSDGSGTARSTRVVRPDAYDCEEPDPEDPEVVCPALVEPIIERIDGAYVARLEVLGPDGEPWQDGIQYALHVLSQSGIGGRADWEESLLLLDVAQAADGHHAITILFEPFTALCERQEYLLDLTVVRSGGGSPGEDGPAVPEPIHPGRPFTCPVLAVQGIDRVVTPGDVVHVSVPLSEGGTIDRIFLGDALTTIPGIIFDSGEGDVVWVAREPGTYTGSIQMRTGEPSCDDDVALRFLVLPSEQPPAASPSPSATPAPSSPPPTCTACDENGSSSPPAQEPETATEPSDDSGPSNAGPDPAEDGIPAPGDHDPNDPQAPSTESCDDCSEGAPGPAGLLLVATLLVVTRSCAGRRAR